ncbi:hypothetical protein [Nonomuraea bangladeshensis]|uniref:hypothetical protein n=1 Tax=Nonomuraea bangladeshensis TaxID=404385 RepID=UPI003C304D53
MTKHLNFERSIIESALNASTYEEAVAVARMIERHIGVRYQRPVGDRFNNYGLMASSGSYEYKALEPVTNGQDAVLERLAAAKWGDLSNVPYQSPAEAAEDLLGNLNYRQQADMVTVAFRESDPPTRSNKRLTIVYRDKGCGMEPAAIPNTIFALGSSHKTGSPWHQGAYGLGGASTYRNAKAIVLVTRRVPEMKPQNDRISVAVVLWEAHGKGQSAYYLVTSNWSPSKNVEPWSAPALAYPDFEPGTHLALISYGVEGFHRARSGDEMSFDMLLNTRLLEPVIPVRFTNEITRDKNEYLRGLTRRLSDNPSDERLSDEEDLLYTYHGVSYRLPVKYYIFPMDKGTRRRFVAKNHTLVFTSNGQVHHHWKPEYFRLRTGLNKLDKRIFVVVETDDLPIEMRTALFTPDRSQLLANEAALQLENQVADFLASWYKLVQINNQLIREAISSASSGRSSLDVGRRIATALKVRGFSLSGIGSSGGDRPAGSGGLRIRKKIETYPDPTTLEGPDKLIGEDGKVRSLEYVLNAVDDFLDSGRGTLTFQTDHPEIDPVRHIAIGRLRDGYLRVQIQIPEGATEGEFKLTAHLGAWQKISGGSGPAMSHVSTLVVVDEIPPRAGSGRGSGRKGADKGAQVAVIWMTPETYNNDWNNAIPGTVDEIEAMTLAQSRPEYKELENLGAQRIPTIVLNRTYTPYADYIATRAKSLTEDGARDAADRYAVGTGLGLLLLHEDLKRREKGKETPVDPEQIVISQQAVARSVLLMMPAFDTLVSEAGIED